MYLFYLKIIYFHFKRVIQHHHQVQLIVEDFRLYSISYRCCEVLVLFTLFYTALCSSSFNKHTYILQSPTSFNFNCLLIPKGLQHHHHLLSPSLTIYAWLFQRTPTTKPSSIRNSLRASKVTRSSALLFQFQIISRRRKVYTN